MARPPPPPQLWQKGRSGNPGGRPKDVLALRVLARSHAPAAIETLVKIMGGNKYPPTARVQAAMALLDRGFGRAPQHLEAELRVEAVRVLAGTEFDSRIIEAVGKLGRKPDGAPLVVAAPATPRKPAPDSADDNGDTVHGEPPVVSFRSMMAELKEELGTARSQDRLEGYRDRDDPPLEPL